MALGVDGSFLNPWHGTCCLAVSSGTIRAEPTSENGQGDVRLSSSILSLRSATCLAREVLRLVCCMSRGSLEKIPLNLTA